MLQMNNEDYMMLALEQSRIAYALGETPVGAVVVSKRDGVVIAVAHNECEISGNPLRHAEVLTIEAAAAKLGDWRLGECALYVTLEPCLMCTGAILESGIRDVFFGAYDYRYGALLSDLRLDLAGTLNVCGGVMERECGDLVREFFRERLR